MVHEKQNRTPTRALRERKPLPMQKFQLKVIRDSNPDFRINPDLDVCRICPKTLWMHHPVGVSHFAKYGTNGELTVIRNPHVDPDHHQK